MINSDYIRSVTDEDLEKCPHAYCSSRTPISQLFAKVNSLSYIHCLELLGEYIHFDISGYFVISEFDIEGIDFT